MSGNAGTHAAKAASRAYDASRARQKQTTELKRQWVLDGELTAEELVEARDRRKAETAARNPSWFEEAA